MTYEQAFSWLSQPGIKAVMPVDKYTQCALAKAMSALQLQIPMQIEDTLTDGYICPGCGIANHCKDKIAECRCANCGQNLILK